MWCYDLNTAGSVDPSGVECNYQTRDAAIEAALSFLQEFDGPLTPGAAEELRRDGKVNVCEEIYENPDGASWPSRKTSIWFLTVFESTEEEPDPDYPDTHRY